MIDQQDYNNFNGNGREEENNIQNLEEEELLINNESLISKLSSGDLMSIINDIFPSLFFIFFLILPFYISPSYCDLNIYLSMKTLIGIYISLILRALIKLYIIYLNKKNNLNYKIFLSLLDLLTSLCYYICIYISYIIYSKSDSRCFKLDTFTIFCFFTIMFMGIISLIQTCIYFIMLSIYLFFMLDSFINNPINFYNRFGMDPNTINNLPSIKADDEHQGICAICLQNIDKENPILILSCPGKHFFHEDCIKQWLLVKIRCPICKSELVL